MFVTSTPIGAQPQSFSSGSTGADGALNINAPGVTYLDPKVMKINAAGDNIFNFTTITIASGSTLKISESRVHGPVCFLAQGDVTINGTIDISGDNSLGPTSTATEQIPGFAGSGGYSGGLGGVYSDLNHQALPGNGPGGGTIGNCNGNYPKGGTFTANRFLVPLIGGSGGGGINGATNCTGYGSQGGAGGGALLIASSTTIRIDGSSAGNGRILATGGSAPINSCGGSGGAVRLVATSIVGAETYQINAGAGGNTSYCSQPATVGLVRLESISLTGFTSAGAGIVGSVLTSLPFALNLPTSPPPTIAVSSINGVTVNANPFSFPDATINTNALVSVVVQATNMPITATVNIYLLSDSGANQAIPVTLTGTTASSTGTVQIKFPGNGTRGFVKATW